MHMFAAITIIITIVLVAIGIIIIHTHSNHHTIRLPKGGREASVGEACFARRLPPRKPGKRLFDSLIRAFGLVAIWSQQPPR